MTYVKTVNINNFNSRQKVTKLSSQTQQVQKACVFWDLDNCHSSNLQQTVVCARRLLKCVHQITGAQATLSAYANKHTINRLACDSQDALTNAFLELDGRIVAVQNRRQSADFAMRSDMHKFVKEEGRSTSSIVCISNDQGFAPIMRFAASKGFLTMCICSQSKKKPSWTRNFNSVRKLPLCHACHLTVVWSFNSSPATLDSIEGQDFERLQGGFMDESLGHVGGRAELPPLFNPASLARPSDEGLEGADLGPTSGHLHHDALMAGVTRVQAMSNATFVWVNPDVQQPLEAH